MPFTFMNIINPIYALITVGMGRNILYADGTRKNIFGKMKQRNVAAAPEDAHKKALAALEAMRAGK